MNIGAAGSGPGLFRPAQRDLGDRIDQRMCPNVRLRNQVPTMESNLLRILGCALHHHSRWSRDAPRDGATVPHRERRRDRGREAEGGHNSDHGCGSPKDCGAAPLCEPVGHQAPA